MGNLNSTSYTREEIDQKISKFYRQSQIDDKILEIDNKLSNYYNKTNVYNKTESYNKTEIDTTLANYYTKTQSDNTFQTKGNYALVGDAYTKGESDNTFQTKGNYALVGDAYTKGESDNTFQTKGNYALVGDAYTKGESNNTFQTKGNYALDNNVYTKTQINTGTIWCANGDCITPSGNTNTKLKWGEHILKMDTDKVIRHVNLQDNHSGMGFATENMYATKSLKIGEGKSACLYLGSHEICSDGGNLLSIKKSGQNKYFDIYSDTTHSSFRTFNTNTNGSERERWQGYA
jgi:hypothetical protein